MSVLYTCCDLPPGKSYMGSPNSSMTDIHLVAPIPLKNNTTPAGSKGPAPALVQWTEVQHHPGLVCALCQVRGVVCVCVSGECVCLVRWVGCVCLVRVCVWGEVDGVCVTVCVC